MTGAEKEMMERIHKYGMILALEREQKEVLIRMIDELKGRGYRDEDPS